MKEANRDGLGPGPPDLFDDTADLGPADGLLDPPRSERPFVQPEAAGGRNELEAALGLEGVQVAARLPADGQDILETGCRDQGHTPALALEEGIGGHGRAVDDENGGGGLQDVTDALNDRQ